MTTRTTQVAQIAIAALAGAGLTALGFTFLPLQAQPQSGWGPGWGPMSASRPGPGMGEMPCINDGVFDPADLETLEGTVAQRGRYGGRQGMYVRLQTGQETVDVHLGPAWYMADQGFEIVTSRPIEVSGFWNRFNGQSVFMAAEVRQNDQVLRLRDANGYPLWRGRMPVNAPVNQP